jgi:hypothetical protein
MRFCQFFLTNPSQAFPQVIQPPSFWSQTFPMWHPRMGREEDLVKDRRGFSRSRDSRLEYAGK